MQTAATVDDAATAAAAAAAATQALPPIVESACCQRAGTSGLYDIHNRMLVLYVGVFEWRRGWVEVCVSDEGGLS